MYTAFMPKYISGLTYLKAQAVIFYSLLKIPVIHEQVLTSIAIQ